MNDDLAFNGYNDQQPGLGAPYPRMLYKKADAGGEEIHGHMVLTVIVDSEEAEDELVADGWAVTPTRAYKPLPAPAPDTRDDTIAELQAQIAAMQGQGGDIKRGPGRPPKAPQLTE